MNDLFLMFKGLAETYGVVFAMFIALVVWVLYKNDQRELRYLSVIQTLSVEVKEQLTRIETRVFNDKQERGGM